MSVRATLSGGGVRIRKEADDADPIERVLEIRWTDGDAKYPAGINVSVTTYQPPGPSTAGYTLTLEDCMAVMSTIGRLAGKYVAKAAGKAL